MLPLSPRNSSVVSFRPSGRVRMVVKEFSDSLLVLRRLPASDKSRANHFEKTGLSCMQASPSPVAVTQETVHELIPRSRLPGQIIASAGWDLLRENTGRAGRKAGGRLHSLYSTCTESNSRKNGR